MYNYVYMYIIYIYIHTYISLSKYILFICIYIYTDYILVYIYHTSIYRLNIRTYVGLLFWHVLRTYQDVQSHPKLTCRGFLADQYRCQKGFWMSKQPPSYQDVIPFDLKYLENKKNMCFSMCFSESPVPQKFNKKPFILFVF